MSVCSAVFVLCRVQVVVGKRHVLGEIQQTLRQTGNKLLVPLRPYRRQSRDHGTLPLADASDAHVTVALHLHLPLAPHHLWFLLYDGLPRMGRPYHHCYVGDQPKESGVRRADAANRSVTPETGPLPEPKRLRRQSLFVRHALSLFGVHV